MWRRVFLVGGILFVAFILGIAGEMQPNEAAFRVAALGNAVPFTVGIAVAILLYWEERRHEHRTANRERREEIQRIARAGIAEVHRILDMAAKIEDALDGNPPIGPIAGLVGFWASALGPRLYALTADDDCLHEVRQAHSALAEAVDAYQQWKDLTAAQDDSLAHRARTAARSAKIWGARAEESLKALGRETVSTR